MARLGVYEEDKLLVPKYVSSLSPYIQQEMEFLTISTLANAFHYANKLEAKQKGKSHFMKNPTGKTSDKKSPTEFDKFNNYSQPTPPNIYHQKKNFQKYKRDHRKQALPRNGMIITVQHGMIHHNAKLERHFWKNCGHLTCLTEPW